VGRLTPKSVLLGLIAAELLPADTVAAPHVIPVLWIFGIGHSTYYGWHTDELPTDGVVTANEPCIAAPAAKVFRPTGRTRYKSEMYDWSGPTPAGEFCVAKGTKGVVKIDPAWDEDSCYPDRPIAIELVGGEHRGKVVAVSRNILRP